MNNLYTILVTLISGLATMLGNLFLLIPIKHKDKVLSFSLSLTFAVIFLISILELIPEGIKLIYFKYNIITIFIMSLIFMIIGAIFVIITDKKINNKDTLYKIGILSMLSILIHNIPEGIICAITSINNPTLGLKMTFLIMIHNIPEGIAITLPIYYATKSKKKALLYTLISGLGEVTGAIITILFLKPFITPFLLYIIFLITAGIMIYLSIYKILKTALNIKKYIYILLGIITGVVVVFITI